MQERGRGREACYLYYLTIKTQFHLKPSAKTLRAILYNNQINNVQIMQPAIFVLLVLLFICPLVVRAQNMAQLTGAAAFFPLLNSIMSSKDDIKFELVNYKPSKEEELVIRSAVFNFITLGTLL